MALEGERNEASFSPPDDHLQRTRVRIEDEYSLYSVRNAVLGRAELLGIAPRDRDELDIIVRELVQNVLTHGGAKGYVEISHDLDEDQLILHLDVVDRGPGFANFQQALGDGFSTTGSLGGGLPSVRRLAERVKLIASSAQGSHLRVSKRFSSNPIVPDRWTFSLYSKPHPGETESGDKGTVVRNREGTLLVLADGLGHGASAAEAAEAVLEVVHSNHRLQLDELINLIHERLKKTRGAAVSLARLIPNSETIEWLGVGNVMGRRFRAGRTEQVEQQVFANFNGTLGVHLGTFKILRYPWYPGDWLMLSTDGLVRNWTEALKDLSTCTPHRLGRRLVDYAARPKDDCSVLVGKSVA